MCRFISCCTQEMLSTPPATNTSASPAMMRCAARAMVCRPDEQKRLTVMPEVVTGQPARKAIWRAMLAPVAPSGLAQPMITSSTSAASMPARCDGVLHGVAAQRGAMGHVEGALPALGQRRAGGGNDNCGCHVIPYSCVQAAASIEGLAFGGQRASSGAGCQNAGVVQRVCAKRFMACTTLNRPTWSA
jgi:hypothetical protein